jgi:hypothetical protein
MDELSTRPELTPERRRVLRQRLLLAATVVHGEDMRTLDCVIRDCSDTGIQIELPKPTALPEQFWLLHHGFALAYEARLAWLRGTMAGLELIGHLSLDPITDPRLRALRRIWLERAPKEIDVSAEAGR